MACLWTSLIAGVFVAAIVGDLLLGLAAGFLGALAGVAATSVNAVGFPEVDARWLRLGPLAAIIDFSTLLIGMAATLFTAWLVVMGPPGFGSGL